jgi:hypothetical protein
MRSLLAAWLASGIVAIVAILALKVLAPEVERGAPVDEYAQVLRVHLPWLLSTLLMAFVAGGSFREGSGGLLRLLVAVPVPLIMAPVAVLTGARVAETAPAALLCVIESALGIVLGAFLAGVVAAHRGSAGAGSRPGELWREGRWE